MGKYGIVIALAAVSAVVRTIKRLIIGTDWLSKRFVSDVY